LELEDQVVHEVVVLDVDLVMAEEDLGVVLAMLEVVLAYSEEDLVEDLALMEVVQVGVLARMVVVLAWKAAVLEGALVEEVQGVDLATMVVGLEVDLEVAVLLVVDHPLEEDH